MTEKEIVSALRVTESRSKRELLDAAAEPRGRDRLVHPLCRGDRRGAGADTVDPRDGAPAGGVAKR